MKIAVANFIKNTRKAKQIKQGELAQMLGIAQASMSRIEAGKESITIERLANIFQALNVSPLVGFENDNFVVVYGFESDKHPNSIYYFNDWIPF